MAEFSIRATLNGPFIVQGATELVDTVGDKYPLGKTTINLIVFTKLTSVFAHASAEERSERNKRYWIWPVDCVVRILFAAELR